MTCFWIGKVLMDFFLFVLVLGTVVTYSGTMDGLMARYHEFTEFEKNFDGQVMIDWTRAHAEVPIFAVTLYLGMVHFGGKNMPFALNLGWAFAVWNLLLCVFSIMGVSRVVPAMLTALQDPSHGETFYDRFIWTCCTDPEEWYLRGPSGLWVGLFIFSKLPELLDTAFLVFQKKDVIFLHWFHHCTVLLYCWHAFHHRIAPGLWFAAMNFSVHSIMYGYYFLSCSVIGLRKVVRPFAPFITFIQIAQMFVGITVTVSAAQQHNSDPESCATDAANWKLGLGMYFCYFVLFVLLFINLYCRDRRRGSKGSSKNEVIQTGCDVGDAAGLFRGKSDARKAKEAEILAKQKADKVD